MKLVLSLLLCFSFIYAQSPKEAYLKAKEYEKNADKEQALIWYKKAIELSLEDANNTGLSQIQSSEYIKGEAKSLIEMQKAYRDYFLHSQDKETDQTIEQILTGIFGISPYHTNYLLPVTFNSNAPKGRKKLETEFQISFRKDMFENLLGFKERYAFAYSQSSYWQTFEISTPFRESNYRPEIFVYGIYKDKQNALKGYQLGLLHESNGRDKERSRSWNRIYLTTFWQIGRVFIMPRVWYRIPEPEKKSLQDRHGDDNPDILKYLGYGTLNILYAHRKNVYELKLTNNLRPKNKGGYRFKWTFPLGGKDFFGYFQYFTGYGNSLEDYNVKNNIIGLGFAVSR